MRTNVICRRCGNERPHRARRLCNACYWWAHTHGALDQYPLTSANEVIDAGAVVDAYLELRDEGLSMIELARRIGIKRTTLYAVVKRAGLARPRKLNESEVARLRRMVGVA